MAVTYPDTVALPVAQQLMQCLCQAVTMNPKPPQTCGFRPYINGAPLLGTTVDECCKGLAFVYSAPAYPSRSAFPAPEPGPVLCGTTWAMQMQMGIWRCAPVGTLQAPPVQGDWDQLQVDLFNDFASLRDALCCFLALRQKKTVSLDGWDVVNDGPEGGCIGTVMTLKVQLT